MIIANPLYDTAFKGLARDPDVATAIIETLLGVTVVEIQLGATEHNKPLKADDKFPPYLRMDYSAVIKDKDGVSQKVLIEMQKASGPEDLFRFREYLAVAGYNPTPPETPPLPIITIYFLGFTLKNVPTPCLKVARRYVDMMTNEELDTKEKFVELLTHDSFIIQAPRVEIDGVPKTKLEKILSVFKQDNFVNGKEQDINYKYPIEDDYVKKMINILHYYATDPDERKKMDEEAYWQRHDDCTVGELIRAQDKLAKAEAALADKDAALAEALASNADKEAALAAAMAEIERLRTNGGTP